MTSAAPPSVAVSGPVILPFLDVAVRRPPQSVSGYIRASGLSDYCPRAEALMRELGFDEGVVLPGASGALRTTAGKTPAFLDSLAMQSTFVVGSAVHSYFQNHVLHRIQGFLGLYRCSGCGHLHDLGPRPVACKVCGNANLLHEESVKCDDVTGLRGSIDGILETPLLGRVGIELKTISRSEFETLHQPLPEHRLQAQAYMHLFDLEHQVFVYISREHVTGRSVIVSLPKGGWSMSAYKEFRMERSRTVMLQLLAQRQAAAAYLDGGPLPPKRALGCQTASSTRAAVCPVCTSCFSR